MCVPYYLMASHLYYDKDKSLYSDGFYDWLCKHMLENWNDIKHVHKKLIDKESLKAGTGYHIKEYPNIVKQSAKEFLNIDDFDDVSEIIKKKKSKNKKSEEGGLAAFF